VRHVGGVKKERVGDDQVLNECVAIRIRMRTPVANFATHQNADKDEVVEGVSIGRDREECGDEAEDEGDD
jgi:hypothetical protein